MDAAVQELSRQEALRTADTTSDSTTHCSVYSFTSSTFKMLWQNSAMVFQSGGSRNIWHIT
ncbi:hypothetical protein EYF80_055782 [Liparis tanakae]|uniref:Uncharacterized protein n=1 Tax=Liparis tanakae TaxID=230148 RepID=A0A4Z2EZ58_9TELE|nr:hypothetical protein EYF80_055782 [Liparis tanakae]